MIELPKSLAAWLTDSKNPVAWGIESFKEIFEFEFRQYIDTIPRDRIVVGMPITPYEGDISNLPFRIELNNFEELSSKIIVVFSVHFDTSQLEQKIKIYCSVAGTINKRTGRFAYRI
ncbi:hypothetical protein KKI24_12725 [bacterium]|nr:hypothetical protein [bacterium]